VRFVASCSAGLCVLFCGSYFGDRKTGERPDEDEVEIEIENKYQNEIWSDESHDPMIERA
jgi:hypothetical protein